MASQVDNMIEHLQSIAARVADCAGDIDGIRSVIEDYSKLDASTRQVDARVVPSRAPAGEWVAANDSHPDKRLLYIHGGSWLSGSPVGYRPLAARISRATGYTVFVLDYRLAPENPFPAGLEDCVGAYRWLGEHGIESARGAQNLVIAGDSAGGNLALATVLKLKDQGDSLPDSVVALSPAVDLAWRGSSLRTHAGVDPILRPERLKLVSEVYLQGAERIDHPYVSPLFGDFSGLERMLVQVGSREVLFDDARRIVELVERQGVHGELKIYEGMPHVFQVFAPSVTTATQAIEDIGRFVAAAG